ncbi:MAG: multiheme c-type cytochrome [Nitrospinales bacterium]
MANKLFKQKKKLLYLLFFSGISFGIVFYYILNYQHTLIPSKLVELARDPELVKSPPAKTCSECHENIFTAWKKSRHSQAWVSEFYTEDSENHSKEKCLPCHIPRSVDPGTKPEPRLDNRNEGVYCDSCHFKDGAMRGPYDLISPPHPTRKVTEFRKSVFCGSCHEKTYKEWQATGQQRTCQSCHMPRALGRLTQKFPLNFLHRKRSVADHSFPHGEIKPDDILVEFKFQENKATLSLTNLAIPHLLPTADNGDPRLYAYISLINSSGKEVGSEKEIISPQKETALPWKKAITYNYFIDSSTASAKLSLQYKPAWTKEKTEIVAREFPRIATE